MAVPAALRRLAGTLATALGIAVAAGCAPMMTFGSMPQVERLQSLRLGASRAGDVRGTLGEPRGRGQASFAGLPQTEVWFYEYMQSDGRKVQMKMLLVFMDKDLYAGHMWFSSGQLYGVTK